MTGVTFAIFWYLLTISAFTSAASGCKRVITISLSIFAIACFAMCLYSIGEYQ